MPYSSADNSTVKLKIVLHKSDLSEKTVFFSVEETAGFSVKVTVERTNFLQYLFLKANDIFPTEVRYQWNIADSNFSYVNSS